MLINSHNHSDFSEKMQKCQDYIQGLEDERRKIQVFQRELPLCLELVTQAIEACKQQLSGTTTEYNLNVQSECSDEETSSHEKPILEDFMPIKRALSHSEDEEKSKKTKNDTNLCNKDVKNCNNDKKKSDWLRSVQLWNQTPDPPSKEDQSRKMEVKRNGNGGAFHSYKKEKSVTTAPPTAPPENTPATTSSTAESGGGGGGGDKKEDKEGRKARRCWSPELHRRFLQALQQLGGAHVATPKQIRELMKVDGLTNDEVKSHLQKYRLHTRRPSTPNQNNNNTNTQTPQFVVVGGIWMPPEYSSMAATTATSGGGAATSNGIYSPIAKLPPPFNHTESENQSHSPATSSSTHTTTASQAYN